MKTISSPLATHLAQGQTTLTYLWKVHRADGVVLGFTTHDEDLIYDAGDGDGAVTYLARTGFTNTAAAGKSDLSVDNMEVTAFLDSSAISETDLRAHLYDNATVDVLLVNWSDLTQGHLHIRRGTLGIVKMVGGMGTSEIRGLAHKLTSNLGATFGPICRAEFGSGLNGIDLDSKYLCKVDVTLYRQTGSVNNAPNARTVIANGGLLQIGSATPTHPPPDGWFNEGFLKFTSGVLNGFSFEIKSWVLYGPIGLFLPMPFQPATNDTFLIEPGCNKTVFDCQNKFANIINFRGEPFLPGEDAILNYPNPHAS